MLEPERTLFLAEKGGRQLDVIRAADAFRIFATMNPGGDFGKKELSPALRNRFTEIWVPALTDELDLLQIIHDRLALPDRAVAQAFAKMMLQFVGWFNGAHGHRRFLSLRDILSWVAFINSTLSHASASASASASSLSSSSSISPDEAFMHGACLVLLDGLGIGTGDSEASTKKLREA